MRHRKEITILKLKALSKLMLECSELMESFDEENDTCHKEELEGASDMVESWIKEINKI